jgi:hypothetical protein
VTQWLAAGAAKQASIVQGLLEDLKNENLARILLVELEHDAEGEITAYEPYLRTRNLAPIAHNGLARSTVESWNDFESKLLKLLVVLGPESISHIHFLADPPLFDRPFHQIGAQSGSPLGEEFVVLLRHRERLYSKKPHVRGAWTAYADLSVHVQPYAAVSVAMSQSAVRLFALWGCPFRFCESSPS